LLTVPASTSALRRLNRSTIWRTERLFCVRSDALPPRFGVHPSTFAGADLFALGGHGLHALVEIAALEERHGQSIETREDRERDEAPQG
jgi:hypothetical protein